jgi:hypothetical protein
MNTKCSLEVKEHWLKAIDLSSPPDATVTNLIGRWCFTFADMGWVTRNVAAAVFATVPKSTYDKFITYSV